VAGLLKPEKDSVRAFYDDRGWAWDDKAGSFADGAVFDDLRAVSASYRRRANDRVRAALPARGHLILDAASGAIQYPEYVRFSEGYARRVCVDLSRRGLLAARGRIGHHGLFVEADVTRLPFVAGAFDAVVSLHTIYHVPADEQRLFLLEIARVLRAGCRAVIVSVWASSAWDLALRIPHAVWRRCRALVRRLRGAPSPAPAPATSAALPLYFHPTRRGWPERSVPPGTRLDVRCWRSVSVDLLRQLPDGPVGSGLAAALGWLEGRLPRLLGRLGAYPLLTLEKDA
jgi:SAM-dependent methyltransferase